MDKLEETLNEVVTRCLSNLVGSDAATTINSCLNPSLATRDPAAYESRLRSLVGEKPSNVILRRIENLLCEKVGLQKRDWESFAKCMEAAKSKIA